MGLAEGQAKGIDYKVSKFPMAANGKSLILNVGEGLVKIIAGKKCGEVLGMYIIGPRSTATPRLPRPCGRPGHPHGFTPLRNRQN